MGGEAVMVVDFGTSASSAVLVVGGEARLVKEPGSGSYSWPSVVCRDGDRLLVGVTAERRKRKDPAGYRAEFKRDLGESAGVPLGDRSFPVEALVAAVLRALRDRAEEMHGGPVTRAVLTVPASYADGDDRRELMIAAGEAAGFVEVDLLAEPVAAALAPVAGRAFRDGDLVLVYDFGGGTFDAALVRFGSPADHEVLGHAALDDCGGRDIDALLIAHLRSEGGAELAEALDDGGSRMVRLRLGLQLSDFARGVKHQLSDVDDVEDYVSPAAPPSLVARADLAALVAPLLDRTVECCRSLLRRCRVVPADVTAVLLVGGTSRMPVVAETVAASLGRPIRRPEDPDLAVVQGAAALEQRRPDPHLEATVDGGGLRWAVPGGAARLVRIVAGPGADYRPGAVLGTARDATGRLWRLGAPAHPGSVTAWDVEPGQRFAAADRPARVARPANALRLLTPPRYLRRLTHDDTGRPGLKTIHHVAFSPDGRQLATTSANRTVYLWDADTGTRCRVIEVRSPAHGVAFSPDGALLATTTEEGAVRLHDTATGEQRRTLWHGTYLQSAAFSPAGGRLVTGGWARTAIVWDVATGAQLLTLPHDNYVQAVVFSPDGSTIATACCDKTAILWRADSGERLLTVTHTAEVNDVAFSPDGRLLVTASDDQTAGLWELPTGRRLLRLRRADSQINKLKAVAVSPDGQWLAAGGDGVTLWDTATGEQLHYERHSYQVNSLTFSPDGHFLAAATSNDAVLHEIADLPLP
ncbi:Hsp70 family protein [Dactylosporangium sp. AC04546]|uniref:Hsp70 family protein n=1 Tax=Dactylosporangium sp. AC04546 TaxID=2862460 RepID=UPI001EDE33A6|nr:Hsp70 family protein [Dactylosporangium sp. AC04546]WVK80598.1 Hsp70 family protein [Dactylosporangium sp. AC04546]